ncbi:hypothetical protein SMC7_00160 [Candidatus Cryosericum terrychapinii]|uniref:Cysteine synthase A n=1 Tax=Candidatus Cryosericum terrychapinii TaxID=2290919 RepID=A0A398CXM0_9BACT|nr:hypothetical protein SMC7_00160 [Candidatus Cryosericum terrychapinii]
MGTSGTLIGLAHFMRQKAPQVQVAGVEPI